MEIDVKGILERNKEMLANQIEAITKDQLKEALEYRSNEVVSEAIEHFLEKEVKPELKKKLKEYKAIILAELVTHLESTVTVLGQSLHEKAKKNLSDSWTLRNIVKELFE